MNPRLYALLAAVAVVGGVTVYTLGTNPDTGQPTTIADVVDAGITVDCTPRIGSCTVELTPEGQQLLFGDAGSSVTYAQVQTGVMVCSDGGVVVPRLVASGMNPDSDKVRFLFDTCRLSPCGASTLCAAGKLGRADNYVLTPKPCRKRPVGAPKDSCMRLLPDGGLYDWGDGNVMPASEAVGAGCVDASCYVTDYRYEP